MYRRNFGKLCVIVLLLSLFTTLAEIQLLKDSRWSRADSEILFQNRFRRQQIDEKTAAYIQNEEEPGDLLALYWLETNYGEETFPYRRDEETFLNLKQQWETAEGFWLFSNVCRSIWDDVQYFPVPESQEEPEFTVSFTDSWMSERTYGGNRGHEGTDIMASVQERGRYPIVSMTDGVIVNKGWLEQGGYRLGIVAPGGAYFYYAHLDSYAELEEGDVVQAGDILGYMGDSGYGEEGTKGKFPVHLHVGIYIYPDGKETSVNPYPVLRYLETRRMKCEF